MYISFVNLLQQWISADINHCFSSLSSAITAYKYLHPHCWCDQCWPSRTRTWIVLIPMAS